MVSPPTPLGAAFSLLPLAGGWGACFAAWFMAFELLSLRRRGPMGAIVLIGAAGVAAGTGVWAQPSLVAAWPTSFEFDPLLTLAALAAMVGAAVWGLSIEWLYPDARGLIGGGAILGGGVAIGQSLLIASLHGPIEIDFGDTPIATAMALASAMAVGGLLVRRRRPGRIGQLAAVVCLTAATTASQGVERAAMMRATGFQAAVDPNALSAAALTPIAGVRHRRGAGGDRALRGRRRPQARHQGSGLARKSAACSIAEPSWNSVPSSSARPMSCSPSGRPWASRPGRQAEAGQAGEVHGHGEDVVQVHRHRIGGVLAEPERRRRRGGRQQRVDLLERGVEIVGDAPAHLQRLQVIGVVVAGREHIGADQHPALDLRRRSRRPASPHRSR